jgi:membrane fusion protein
MSTPLFREEVTQAQSAQWLGVIRIGRQPKFALVAAVAIGLGCALVLFAILGEATRKVRVAGLLTPLGGNLALAAQATGTVQAIDVAEGDWVRAGQVLLTLNTDRAGAAGNTAALVAQTLAQRQITLDTERQLRELQTRQRQQALADRMRALRTEADQAEREAEGAQRRVDLAQRNVDRYQQLAQAGFVAEAQAQQRQDEWLDLKARADAARRSVAALKREWQSLQAEQRATATQGETEQAQLDRSAAALAQERAEVMSRQTLVLSAPKAGVVTALHVHAGTSVQPGQVLATLVPQTQPDAAAALEAQLYAPSRTAGFVRSGQPVWIRLAAYPYQKFGMARGEVSDVSRTPVNPQELPPGQASALLAAAQSNEPLYRIRVKLIKQHVDAYGKPQPLTPGMALEADIVQDRRAVWEWVLEPLLVADARWNGSDNQPSSSIPSR